MSKSASLPVSDLDAGAPALQTGLLSKKRRMFSPLYGSALLLPLVFFLIGAWWSWISGYHAAEVRTERLTTSLAGHAERLIAVQETLLNSILARIRGLDWDTISSSDEIKGFMIEQGRLAQSSLGTTIVRPDTGHIVAWSNAKELPDVDVSDRDYFKSHRAEGPQTHIGEVVVSRPYGTIGFPVSRRDLNTGTIAVSLIEVQSLMNFYATLREAPDDVVSVIRDDGVLLTRFPAPKDPVGLRIASAYDVPIAQVLKEQTQNMVLRTGVTDGVDRYYRSKQVGSYPIYVTYGIAQSTVLNAWLRQLLPLGVLCLATLVLLGLLARRVERSVEAQRKAEIKAETSRVQALHAERLAASEARLRNASEAVGLTYVVIEYGENRVKVADNYKAVMGFSVPDGQDITAADEMLLDRINPADRPRVVEAIRRLDTGKAQNIEIEFRITGDDGDERWIESTWTLERDASGVALRSFCTHLDITPRKLHEEHQRLLMNELNHRVKNTLASVQSIASQTLRNSPDVKEGRERFEARLMALAKAHDILTQQNWTGAPLRDLIDGATAAYRSKDQDRFEIEGPNIRLPPRSALALALAIHELCTNASKYGALSNEKGRVRLVWSVKEGRRLHIRWSESGGPPVEPPTRRGFGSRLIERGLASDIGGEITIDFSRTGVVCTIDAPLEDKAKGEAVHA